MKLAMMLFMSALVFSAPKDPLAEERYKAKYGRYSPAEEARIRAEKKREAAKRMAPAETVVMCGEAAATETPADTAKACCHLCCKHGS